MLGEIIKDLSHHGFGVGIDIIETSRFKDIMKRDKKNLGIFTNNEVSYCVDQPNPAQHFAARFAAKESVIKAFSSFKIQIMVRQIEIIHGAMKVPEVKFHDINVRELNKYTIKISLSHSKQLAIAIALIVKVK